jgi:hypothetical protein
MTPMTWRSRSRNSKRFWPSRTGWSFGSTLFLKMPQFRLVLARGGVVYRRRTNRRTARQTCSNHILPAGTGRKPLLRIGDSYGNPGLVSICRDLLLRPLYRTVWAGSATA